MQTLNLGIVGTGIIARAMVEGLLQEDRGDLRIFLSPRNPQTVQDLCARFPVAVYGCASNQEVIDRAGTVILSVRPPMARAVLPALRFRADQTIISVMAGISRESVQSQVRPAAPVILGIPLPAMARGAAITALMPPHTAVAALFRRAGPVLEIDNPEAFTALSATTALMAAQYKLWATASQWLVRHQLAPDEAQAYVLSLVSGLISNARAAGSGGLEALGAEVALPGSYNEQLRLHMESRGVFTATDDALDAALARMKASREPVPKGASGC